MEQLIDFFPLLVFFISFKIWDIYIATGALIAASLIQIILTRLLTGKFRKMHIYMFLVLAVMGTLTIIFQDPDFLKWKVTVIELILAAAFFISQKMGRPLAGLLFRQYPVPEQVIRSINMQWCLFSLLIAILNLLVAFGLPRIMEDQEAALNWWVNFKVWGVLLLSLVLAIATAVQTMPYLPADNRKTDADPRKDEPSAADPLNTPEEFNSVSGQAGTPPQKGQKGAVR